MKEVTQTGRVLTLCCLLAGGVMSLPASATDDMPEVLRYARQYSQANPESVMRPAGEKKVRSQVGDVGTGLSRKLARSELIRRQQQVQLKALEEKLRASEAALKAEKYPEGARTQDVQTLQLKNDALSRDLAAATEKQATLARQLRELQQEKEALLTASGVDCRAQRTAQQKVEAALQLKNDALSRDLAAAAEKQTTLARQLSELQQEKDALLTKTGVEVEAQQTARQAADAALKAKSAALVARTTELAAARQRVDALAAEKSSLETTLQTLRQQKTPQKTGGQVPLKTATQRQAYAAGVMYARDVREAQEGNRMLGVGLESAALMAGLNDALSGQPLRLEEKELVAAGHDLELVAGEGFRRVTDAQKKQAEAWLKTFRKEKGAEKDERGFWYRVTYAGDGELLKPEDTVDVVVEESLTNGKVVSDMDRAGNSLRQKVRDFPPVFSAGLLRLKNHGQITLVVPPELAYGDKGYPPDVPPGATMIYRVRVADRIMESELQPTAPVRPGSKERILGRRAG